MKITETDLERTITFLELLSHRRDDTPLKEGDGLMKTTETDLERTITFLELLSHRRDDTPLAALDEVIHWLLQINDEN